MYLFPYREVKSNARIIIYGAGKVGLDFMRQVTASGYVQLLCMVDQDYRIIRGISDVTVPVIPREEIFQFDGKYDVILIAALRQETAFGLKENLCRLGVSADKIIWPEIMKAEDVSWGKWRLSALRDDVQRRRAMEGFAREGKGKVSYFAYMIAEIRMAEDKDGLLTELFSFVDREECLEYKIIMLRIFVEAGLVNGEWTRKFLAAARQIEPLDSRYLLLSDIAIFPVHFAQCLYREFYLELREAYRELMEAYGLRAPSRELMEAYRLRVPSKRREIVENGKQKAAVLFNWLGGTFSHGDFKRCLIEELAEEGFEVRIFCLDIRLWYSQMCFIEPFDDMSCNVRPSVSYASIHKEMLGDIAQFQYIEGRAVKQRMQESIDKISAWNPDVIIDITDEVAPQSYILNQYFPVYYIPMRGFSSSMFFAKKLVEGKQAADYCNHLYPSLSQDQMSDCFMKIEIPQEKEKRNREEFQWAESDFVIITVGGRLDHELEEDFLRQICCMLRENLDMKWLLVGTSKIPVLKDVCNDLLESGQIRVLGYENDLMGIFGICDVYLNPRRTGGEISQRWAAGRNVPVIADASMWFDAMESLGWENLCWSLGEQIEKILRMKNDRKYYQHVKEQTELAHQQWKTRVRDREVVKAIKEFIGMPEC